MKRKIVRLGVLALSLGCCVSSCTKDELYSNGSVSSLMGDGLIRFSIGQEQNVRATGADAATLLGSEFRVWAKKYKDTEVKGKVFTGDSVLYSTITAGQWDYKNGKYWDTTGVNKYIFHAYSDKNDKKENIDYSTHLGFDTLQTNAAIDTSKLSKLYIAEDSVVGQSNFGGTVKLTFKSMCSWVRFKFVNNLKSNTKIKVKSFKMQNGTFSSNTKLYLVTKNADAKFVAKDDGSLASTIVTYEYGSGKPIYSAVEGHQLIFGDSIVGTSSTSADSISHATNENYRFDKKNGEYTKVFPTPSKIEASANPYKKDSATLTFTYSSPAINDGEVLTGQILIPDSLMEWKMNKKYTYEVSLSEGSLNLRRIEFEAETEEIPTSDTLHTDTVVIHIPHVKAVQTYLKRNTTGAYDSAVTKYAVQLWKDGPWWAQFNVGATIDSWEGTSIPASGSPYADTTKVLGCYYNWGITVDQSSLNNKKSYCTDDDLDGIANISHWIKTNSNDTIGDAATKNWGINWQMPDTIMLNHLRNKTYNGVSDTAIIEIWQNCVSGETNYKNYQFEGSSIPGYCFKGKGDYALDSIFFPAAGRYKESISGNVGTYGYCWSGVRYESEDKHRACILYLNGSTSKIDNSDRWYGRSVRAVWAK